MQNSKHNILDFWFKETLPQQWFQVSDEFDALVRARYGVLYHNAASGMIDDWQTDSDGALALCIVLDQFPRTMFRGQPQAYATDKKALLVAKQAIHKGFDIILTPLKRRFLYLPFEHSETLNDQRRSVQLFETMKHDDPVGYEHALKHLQVIERFGRFPGRNAALSRSSTPEELEYLKNPLF
jgi:uncharacterized protein (DUF924 family)